MADARKGMVGRRGTKIGRARDAGWGKEGGTEAPAAKPLFISSFPFAGERKIAIGSFLIWRQSMPDATFRLVEMFWKPLENENQDGGCT